MANLVQMVLFFCLLNAITILPHLTNASSKSNGAHSPPFNPSGTHAALTLNGFGRGGDGGDPSECDGKFHPLPERVVALSTDWYDNGARCGKMIRIRAKNGKTTLAKVVDECDTSRGCRGNIVDASKAVWKDLGLNTDVGVVPIIWSMA
ncbi:hypothetical protein PIB30_016806 [Stylosanthes scabra]|uniref:Uncharacterized protein n=1 Tax=Stylosanthes scabra TaxID=79078 RepID=A0ABU6S7L0_9FABA|nr:hypothetical protein [Stylosanthes scabra]